MAGTKTALLLAAALLAGASLACGAQAPKTPEPDRFTVIDTNGDGKIVVEEFRTAFPNMNEKAFVVIDTNGDNGIDSNEWAAFMEGHSRGNIPGAREEGAPLNNIPGDPLIPPVDSNDLPLMRPPAQ